MKNIEKTGIIAAQLPDMDPVRIEKIIYRRDLRDYEESYRGILQEADSLIERIDAESPASSDHNRPIHDQIAACYYELTLRRDEIHDKKRQAGLFEPQPS